MEITQFSGYTEEEKVRIASEFLIKRQIREKGLSGYPVVFTEQALYQIIRAYTREAGIRELERNVATICRKIARELVRQTGAGGSVTVTPELVEHYLGPRRYRLEIIEYDKTGKHLDDTVFYVRYAQEVRELIGESEEAFILSFLADTNHIAQDLMARGCDPHQVFGSVLATGRTMNATTGSGFYADVQQFRISDRTTLFCFQVPCGGSIFLVRTPDETVMIDTGYGIYHDDVLTMLSRYDAGDMKKLSRIIVTHADADHCGASGYFSVPVLMHEDTLEIIRRNNRAYGSRSEDSVLEAFYTKMINLFSRFRTPSDIRCFSRPAAVFRGIFPVIGTVRIGDLELEVLDGLGGHTCGQVFLYSRTDGLLFAADSVINFGSLTKERADYSSLAAFLVTSVNVDSERAKQERVALLGLARETDEARAKSGRRCLICGGHGAVSVLEDGKLVAYGKIERYEAGSPGRIVLSGPT